VPNELYPLEEAERLIKQQKDSNEPLRLVLKREAVEQEEPGTYNEAFLANVRKILLIAEKEGVGVFIETEKTGGDQGWVNHAKRRLKNCKAVTGWSEP
jgi:hypothetical protein